MVMLKEIKKSLNTYIELYVKKHPIKFVIYSILEFATAVLLVNIFFRVIDDINKGIKAGTFNSLNILALIGTVAGLISLGWQIWNKNFTSPSIEANFEIIEKDRVPDKFKIIAKNYGKTIEINRVCLTFKGSNWEYYQYQKGLVRDRLRAGGIPYEEEFDLNKLIEVMIEHDTYLRSVYIEDDNSKKYYLRLPKNIIEKFNDIKIGTIYNKIHW